MMALVKAVEVANQLGSAFVGKIEIAMAARNTKQQIHVNT